MSLCSDEQWRYCYLVWEILTCQWVLSGCLCALNLISFWWIWGNFYKWLWSYFYSYTLLRFKWIDEFIFTCSIKHKFLSPQSFLRHSFTWATFFENWSPLGVVFSMSNLFAMSIIFFDISSGCLVDFKSFVPIWMMASFGDCLTEGWMYACISSVFPPGNDFPVILLVFWSLLTFSCG